MTDSYKERCQQYERDMSQLYTAVRDLWGNIVKWQRKADGVQIQATAARQYWEATRSAPPPF